MFTDIFEDHNIPNVTGNFKSLQHWENSKLKKFNSENIVKSVFAKFPKSRLTSRRL